MTRDQFIQQHDDARKRLLTFFQKKDFTPDEAEDLAQACLANAYKHLHQLAQPQQFQRWLMGIAKNMIKNFLRDNNRQKRDADEVALETVAEPASEAEDALAELLAGERRHLLRREVEQLPSRQRQVFTLRYYHGLTLRETAAMLHLGENTIKSTQHNAVKCLTRKLSPPPVAREVP
ncbi:MAG: RNA polymerase sigma factor [Acidobacteriota bacterium]|nr:RNA polymerase sigma factor [Acidobacteriota bacterium]